MTNAEFAAGVERAYRRIRADIVRTPLAHSPALSRASGTDVFVKWECDQRTGSFKLRGAFNALRALPAARRRAGIVSASTGNHGLAMSEACRTLGLRLELHVPATITLVKKRKLASSGADVIVDGDSCEAAEAGARAAADAGRRVFISPYNDIDVIFGQGTIGLEILEDVSDAAAVLVPVGGGGLAAGIAGYLRARAHEVEVWGVEPANSAFLRASFAAGRLVEIEEKPTLADAVAGGIEPGSITFGLCRRALAGLVAVSERSIRKALDAIAGAHGRTIEGAGALPLAGLITERRRFRGRKIVLVVSGRNAAPAA